MASLNFGTGRSPSLQCPFMFGTGQRPSLQRISSFSAHICSMMLSPNCEHLISVAPSIKRAKS